MSFYANNNRIYVTDTVSNIVFDTDRKMFAVTDHIVGTVSIANKSSGSEVAEQYQSQYLATINPNADFVMGHCRAVSGPGDGGLPNIGIFNAGGSILWGWVVYSRGGSARKTMYAGWIFHFVAGGGQLLLTEEWWNIRVLSSDPSYTLVGGTINYSLYCGTFV